MAGSGSFGWDVTLRNGTARVRVKPPDEGADVRTGIAQLTSSSATRFPLNRWPLLSKFWWFESWHPGKVLGDQATLRGCGDVEVGSSTAVVAGTVREGRWL